MKRFLILIFLVPLFCKAQNIDNLDIKNGFLQYHFGDSLSKHQAVLLMDKPHNGFYDVVPKAIKFPGNRVDKVSLAFVNDVLVSVMVEMNDDYKVEYVEKVMKKAYGEGKNVENGLELTQGFHKSLVIWNGKRVSAILTKNYRNFSTNNGMLSSLKGVLIFAKTSDAVVDGVLSPNFVL